MYIDARQHRAWCRMASYDALPAYKRSFLQRNTEYFDMDEVRRCDLKTLKQHRARRVAAWVVRNYGYEHPNAKVKP